MNKYFEVGDCVGDADVRIEILSIDLDPQRACIAAKVIELGYFYSAHRLMGGYILGETIMLYPSGTILLRPCLPDARPEEWVVSQPSDRPWHVLSCIDGVKAFEHYR
jgi:hypothetical protein